MKRKFGDRANWRRITNRQFTCRYVESEEFTGYLSLYTIHELKEPLWKTYGGYTFCTADKGYSWLQYFPKDEHFVVTAMFDDQERIIEWYIDTCRSQESQIRVFRGLMTCIWMLLFSRMVKYSYWMRMNSTTLWIRDILRPQITNCPCGQRSTCCIQLMRIRSLISRCHWNTVLLCSRMGNSRSELWHLSKQNL